MPPTGINCGNLIDPTNGMVTLTSTEFDGTATYFCFSGFELSTGGSTLQRMCGSDGEWTLVDPTCDGKTFSDSPSEAVSIVILC